MTENHKYKIDEAAKLNRLLRLSDIGLYRIETNHLSPREVPNQRWAYSTAIGPVIWAVFERKVVGIFQITVKIQQDKEEKGRVDVAEIKLQDRVVYEMNDSMGADDVGRVPHFLAFSGWTHVWPFIREEIQTMSVKLGFPPLVLPLALAGQFIDVPVHRLAEPAQTSTPVS